MTETQLLADRATGIGGSDIASVLGIGYGCALRLYRSKRQEVPDYPREETAAMELGKLLEPWVAKKFAEKHGYPIREVGVKRSVKYPFLMVHADRIYQKASGEPCVLEIKAVGSRVFYQAKREGLPIDYLCQLQFGMGLWNTAFGSFALCNRDTGEILDWEHKFDREMVKIARDRAIQLWQNIEAANPPARLSPEDPRCSHCEYRKSCQGNALIHIDAKAKMENDESLRPLLKEYEDRKAEFEIAEEALETQKELVKNAMGDRVAVACGDSKIYYRPQTRTTWAAEEMAFNWCMLNGKVDYDGTFIPAAPADALKFKREGMPFRSLRVYQ
jgi:predicted phage-related endonuclease